MNSKLISEIEISLINFITDYLTFINKNYCFHNKNQISQIRIG